MILFHLFFFCAQPFDQKLGSSFIYFFYLYMTIRPKIRVLIDLFFFICTRPFDLKLGSSLIYLFHLHATIRQKYMIVFHLFFLCAQPNSGPHYYYYFFFFFHLYTTIPPKLGRGNFYSLIYSFFNCANISFAIFMAVLPLYLIRSISASTAFIFHPLYS